MAGHDRRAGGGGRAVAGVKEKEKSDLRKRFAYECDQLARFAQELKDFVKSEKDQGLCPPSLNFERADYVIASLESFLSGKSLNHAFFRPKRGRPKGSGSKGPAAIEAAAMLERGMTLEAIAAKIGGKSGGNPRDVQNLLRDYQHEIMADIARRLTESLPVIKSRN